MRIEIDDILKVVVKIYKDELDSQKFWKEEANYPLKSDDYNKGFYDCAMRVVTFLEKEKENFGTSCRQ